jgi:hypothetical protein
MKKTKTIRKITEELFWAQRCCGTIPIMGNEESYRAEDGSSDTLSESKRAWCNFAPGIDLEESDFIRVLIDSHMRKVGRAITMPDRFSPIM